MDMQKLLNAMSDGWRRDRSKYHLTLGDAMERLAKVDPEMRVQFEDGISPGEADSYRGYYSDLALEPCGTLDTAGKLHAELSKALNATFEGYKGGDFVMGAETPLWRATYGCCGPAIVGITEANGVAVLTTKEVD